MKDNNTGNDAATIELPPGDLDAIPAPDNTIRNCGCFTSTTAVKAMYPNPRRGDGCFIGNSVAFWNVYRNQWEDYGPLIEKVTKGITNLGELDLSTLFQLVGDDYTPVYTGPSDGIQIIGSFGGEAHMRKIHPTGKENQGVMVRDELFVWDIDQEDWISQGSVTGPSAKPAVESIPVTSIVFERIGVLGGDVVKVIGDFHTREIAAQHAPKVGQKGLAYVADNDVWVWNEEWKAWANEGAVGEVWQVQKPATAPGMAHALKPIWPGHGASFPSPALPGSARDLEQREQRRQAQEKSQHEKELLIDSKEHPSLNDVATLLEGALNRLEGEESDAAFKALDALKKVRKDLRRKRIRHLMTWLMFLVVAGCGGYLLYKWLPTQVVTGRYTVPKTCSVPFGKGEITGQRFYDYSYKSLFGIHMTLESTVTERTIVNVGGQEVTIFGLAPKLDVPEPEEVPVADQVLKAADVEVVTAPKPPKGKWWRMNVLPGDKGTMNMKPAELYLFFSEKDTAMISYKTFCSANKDE